MTPPTELFDYPPIALPMSLLALDDITVFAAAYPQQYRWLCRQTGVCITCFRWPEMLGRLLHQEIGTRVCQLRVEVPIGIARQFAALKCGAPG